MAKDTSTPTTSRITSVKQSTSSKNWDISKGKKYINNATLGLMAFLGMSVASCEDKIYTPEMAKQEKIIKLQEEQLDAMKGIGKAEKEAIEADWKKQMAEIKKAEEKARLDALKNMTR